MNRQRIHMPLERNWYMLKQESGDEWRDIVKRFDDALKHLADEPMHADMMQLSQDLSGVLNRYRYGRDLLNVITAIVEDEPDDTESYNQRKNRLRDLVEREKREQEQQQVV